MEYCRGILLWLRGRLWLVGVPEGTDAVEIKWTSYLKATVLKQVLWKLGGNSVVVKFSTIA